MQSNNPLGLFVIFLIQVPTIAFRQLRELDHVNLNQVTLHIESHFQSFTIFMPKKSDETKHAPQSTLTQNNITVLKDGAFWGLSKVRILQTLTLQSQANDIAQNLTLWQSLCLSLIPIMI